jgi:L-alanine-DL-glutamate epimerase-like enolase superfamily enzyme
MMRGYFYPAGREKLHSLGALDLALWDLKGKALDVPVWQLLGGKSRNHVELYSTVFPHRAVAPWRTWRKPAATPASAPIATLPTTRESA